MTIPVQGFNVAAIYCDDLDASVRFYTDVLGFEKLAEIGGGVQLGGAHGIDLYLQGGYARDARDYDSAKVSLCFNTTSVKTAERRARELNVPVTFDYKEVAPNYAMLCVADPSGNQIMFMGAP